MDFLDPKKKRAHKRRLMVGYGLIAIILAIMTTALVLVTNGYGVDRKGTIIQKGLVFVSAHPVGANIYINGQSKGRTDGRFDLEQGKYSIELQQPGYRTWRRDINLEGSSIERLVYPFLFPTSLVSRDVKTFDTAPDVVSESPDRHWIVSHTSAAPTNFDVTDTSTKENLSVTITIPAAVLGTHANQHFEAIEWSTDNRHLLLKDTYTGGVDYIMLDRETPENTLNLTQVFGHSFTRVALHDKRYDQLYVYDTGGGLLEAADLKTKILNPIAGHVLDFWPYGSSNVVYVTDDNAPQGKVYAKITDNDKSFLLRTLPASQVYLVNMASFSGHQYVAVGTSAESRVYLYEDPLDALEANPVKTATAKALLKVANNAEYVSFSANARFVAVQGGSAFAVYDAENNRQFRYDIELKLDPQQKANWMDGHRLMIASGGKLNIFDFDGTNKQELTTALPSFIPMFDRDYTALFTASPSLGTAAKTGIMRTELVVKQ